MGFVCHIHAPLSTVLICLPLWYDLSVHGQNVILLLHSQNCQCIAALHLVWLQCKRELAALLIEFFGWSCVSHTKIIASSSSSLWIIAPTQSTMCRVVLEEVVRWTLLKAMGRGLSGMGRGIWSPTSSKHQLVWPRVSWCSYHMLHLLAWLLWHSCLADITVHQSVVWCMCGNA